MQPAEIEGRAVLLFDSVEIDKSCHAFVMHRRAASGSHPASAASGTARTQIGPANDGEALPNDCAGRMDELKQNRIMVHIAATGYWFKFVHAA
ncbi:hypothetical protein [Sphingomonas sp. MMS24-J13]|uniref:hypothetical protein n=1 Tax=Sphingomonas sp. MMS24-J13 TaxID=3238686 RepID=UPI0038507FE2